MKPNKFIYFAICFLFVSCESNEFKIDYERLIIRGEDSPIRCLEIKNVTSESLEYYEIKNNKANKRLEISITNPPDGYVITDWHNDTLRNIILKEGDTYTITNRSVYDASSVTKVLTHWHLN